jgi:hypothetical protein
MEPEFKYLKLCFENQIKRITFPNNFTDLQRNLIESFFENFSYSDLSNLKFSYLDEESDSVNISNNFDLQQTLKYMKNENLKSIKINITRSNNEELKNQKQEKTFVYKPQCAACNLKEITGVRWKCSVCPGVNFCFDCTSKEDFTHVHSLIKIVKFEEGKFQISDDYNFVKSIVELSDKKPSGYLDFDQHTENYYELKKKEVEKLNSSGSNLNPNDNEKLICDICNKSFNSNVFAKHHSICLKIDFIEKQKNILISDKKELEEEEEKLEKKKNIEKKINSIWRDYSKQFRDVIKKMKDQNKNSNFNQIVEEVVEKTCNNNELK